MFAVKEIFARFREREPIADALPCFADFPVAICGQEGKSTGQRLCVNSVIQTL